MEHLSLLFFFRATCHTQVSQAPQASPPLLTGQLCRSVRAKQAHSVGEAQWAGESPSPSLVPLSLKDKTTWAWAQPPKPASDCQCGHAPPWPSHTMTTQSYSALKSQPTPSFSIPLLPSTLSSWQTKHLPIGVMQPLCFPLALGFISVKEGAWAPGGSWGPCYCLLFSCCIFWDEVLHKRSFPWKIPAYSSLSGLSSCTSFLSAKAIMRAVQFLEGVAELGIVHAFLAA